MIITMLQQRGVIQPIMPGSQTPQMTAWHRAGGVIGYALGHTGHRSRAAICAAPHYRSDLAPDFDRDGLGRMKAAYLDAGEIRTNLAFGYVVPRDRGSRSVRCRLAAPWHQMARMDRNQNVNQNHPEHLIRSLPTRRDVTPCSNRGFRAPDYAPHNSATAHC